MKTEILLITVFINIKKFCDRKAIRALLFGCFTGHLRAINLIALIAVRAGVVEHIGLLQIRKSRGKIFPRLFQRGFRIVKDGHPVFIRADGVCAFRLEPQGKLAHIAVFPHDFGGLFGAPHEQCGAGQQAEDGCKNAFHCVSPLKSHVEFFSIIADCRAFVKAFAAGIFTRPRGKILRGETMKPIITISNIYKIYNQGDNEVHALDGISLTIERGEFVAIVGRSGSGKSTLMNVLGCLDTPTAGEYVLDGENVDALSEDQLSRIRNQKIGFIFQGFNLVPGLTALENVELPLSYRGIPREERRALAEEALNRVGLAGRMRHRPGQMSGGQQQRVAIARAIAARPPIILADEPTGNLDTKSGAAVMDILHGLHKEGRTILLITHDERIAQQAQRRVAIRDGALEETARPKSSA